MLDVHACMLSNGHVGPPPPSPPASVEREIIGDAKTAETQEAEDEDAQDQQELLHPGLRLVAQSPPVDDVHHPLPILSSGQLDESLMYASSRVYQHSFADAKDSSSTLQPATLLSSSQAPLPHSATLSMAPGPSSTRTQAQPPSSGLTKLAVPPNANLHPPPVSRFSRERPTRRNTTGSSPHAPHSAGVSRGHVLSSSRIGVLTDDGIPMGSSQAAQELETEIQQAAEQIRRERLSKRAKQQAQQAQHDAVEAALTRSDTRRSAGSGKEDVVLVGNLIGEGHVNYILMYNMLTGIRVGVRI